MPWRCRWRPGGCSGAHGAAGLVLVGFGGGSYPQTFLDAGTRAVQAGVPVVLATRALAGRVIMTPRKAQDGFIVADDLLPQKAHLAHAGADEDTRASGPPGDVLPVLDVTFHMK